MVENNSGIASKADCVAELDWKDSESVDSLLDTISEIIAREFITEERQNDPTRSDKGGEK